MGSMALAQGTPSRTPCSSGLSSLTWATARAAPAWQVRQAVTPLVLVYCRLLLWLAHFLCEQPSLGRSDVGVAISVITGKTYTRLVFHSHGGRIPKTGQVGGLPYMTCCKAPDLRVGKHVMNEGMNIYKSSLLASMLPIQWRSAFIQNHLAVLGHACDWL